MLIAALAAAGFLALAAAPLRSRPARFALAAAVAATAAATLLALYPGALRASQATADAATATLFLPHVAEMRPLGPGSPRDLVLHAGGLLSLLLLPLALRRPGGVMLALVALASAAATLQHRRFGADLAAATALLAPGFLHLLPRRPAGAALAAALATLPPYAGLFLPAGDTPPRDPPGCDWPAMADHLATLPPTTIFTDGWRATPELAWRTPHRFVVAPYHRAGQAFQDTADVMRATDDPPARAILARRGATLVLLCAPQRHAMLGPPDPASLEQRLRAEAPPAWLRPLPLPPALAAFRLLRVQPE